MRMSLGDATANRWAKRFLRYLTAEVNQAFPGDGRHVVHRVRDAAQALFNAQSHALPDKQTRCHLGLCALVLAGYRELSGSNRSPSQKIRARWDIDRVRSSHGYARALTTSALGSHPA